MENMKISSSLMDSEGQTDGLRVALAAAESRRKEQEELLQVSDRQQDTSLPPLFGWN